MNDKELKEIEDRLKRSLPQSEYREGAHRLMLGRYSDYKKNDAIDADYDGSGYFLIYDDGDQCAKIRGNLGLDIDGEGMATMLAHAGEDISKLLAEVRNLKKDVDILMTELAKMIWRDLQRDSSSIYSEDAIKILAKFSSKLVIERS